LQAQLSVVPCLKIFSLFSSMKFIEIEVDELSCGRCKCSSECSIWFLLIADFSYSFRSSNCFSISNTFNTFNTFWKVIDGNGDYKSKTKSNIITEYNEEPNNIEGNSEGNNETIKLFLLVLSKASMWMLIKC